MSPAEAAEAIERARLELLRQGTWDGLREAERSTRIEVALEALAAEAEGRVAEAGGRVEAAEARAEAAEQRAAKAEARAEAHAADAEAALAALATERHGAGDRPTGPAPDALHPARRKLRTPWGARPTPHEVPAG